MCVALQASYARHIAGMRGFVAKFPFDSTQVSYSLFSSYLRIWRRKHSEPSPRLATRGVELVSGLGAADPTYYYYWYVGLVGRLLNLTLGGNTLHKARIVRVDLLDCVPTDDCRVLRGERLSFARVGLSSLGADH